MQSYISRNQIEIPESDIASRTMGRELRKKGYRLYHHPIWGDHVVTPSGEEFDETRMIVRHRMVTGKEQKIIEEAYKYLILCQKRLCNIRHLGFSIT